MNNTSTPFVWASLAALLAFACGDDDSMAFDASTRPDASTPDACVLCDDAGSTDANDAPDAALPTGASVLLRPAPGSTLSGAAEVFEWSDGGEAERAYDLYVGSTMGGAEYFDSDGIGSVTTQRVEGLPTDGRALFVRLHWTDDAWATMSFDDYRFTAAGGTAAVCGDGITTSPETCDDGNATAGDGCSSLCRLEQSTPAEIYGNPQIVYSLTDTNIGGTDRDLVSRRVKFPFAGTMVSVRPFIIFVEGVEGHEGYYHNGDGGTFELQLRADDGTPQHLPSETILARTGDIIGIPSMYEGSGPAGAIVGGDPGDSGFFRNLAWTEPVVVEANTYYHLVFRNTASDPVANYVSVDDFRDAYAERTPATFLRSDPLLDEIYVSTEGSGVWRFERHKWAIGEYLFEDGRAFGNGYMEVGSVSGPDRVSRYVDGSRSVRQTFTPETDFVATYVAVGAMHVSGTNRLSLRITDAAGAELWAGSTGDFPTGVPSGDPRGGATLDEAEFRGSDTPAMTFVAGREYILEVQAEGGQHVVTAVRDGTLSYRYHPSTTVRGYAQLREGGGAWQGWPLRAEAIEDQFDLSFYLRR